MTNYISLSEDLQTLLAWMRQLMIDVFSCLICISLDADEGEREREGDVASLLDAATGLARVAS